MQQLEAGEDHFIKPARGGNVYRSAKTEARRALVEMPAEGRDSYELQFGAVARQTLDEAVARGDIEAIALGKLTWAFSICFVSMEKSRSSPDAAADSAKPWPWPIK